MKYIYTLISLLLPCILSAQVKTEPDFNKIKDYQVRIDSIKHYCDELMGKDSAKGDDFPQALIYGFKGLTFSRKDDVKAQAQFSLIVGIAYYNLTRFDSALYYMEKSSGFSIKSANTSLIAWSNANLIPLYIQTQKAGAADSAAQVLKSIIDTTKNTTALAKCFHGLGNYYYFKSYYATAQSYFLRSLEINKVISDTSTDNRYRIEYAVQNYMLYKIYYNNEFYDKSLAALKDGSQYMRLSSTLRLRYNSAFIEAYTTLSDANIDSALFYYNQLRELPKSTKGISSEYVMSNIALAQFYIKKAEFGKALPYIDKAMALAEESKASFLIHQAQNIKGIYMFRTGNYDEAIQLLEESLPISKNINMGNYLESSHLVAEAYRAKGNLKKAMEYFDIYDKEKDAYTKANMTRNFADLETQYRTKEKEKEIKSLNNKNKLRELELENERRLRLLMIVGLVAMGIISLLLYRFYLNKEKLNKALNERNEALDNLNARLAIANESKAKLFGIFSHDLRSPIGKIAQFLRLQKENPDLFNDNARSEYHEKFTNTTNNLLNTMEDLLIWSKSQMENFTPEYHSVVLYDLVNKEIDLLRNQIEEKKVKMDNQIPESFISLTDENFVAIIIRNLLQNAVRYSNEAGTVTLFAAQNYISITNRSETGLNAAALNGLLQKGEVNSNNFGLGLQIAKDLAERIGITISFVQEDEHHISALLQWN